MFYLTLELPSENQSAAMGAYMKSNFNNISGTPLITNVSPEELQTSLDAARKIAGDWREMALCVLPMKWCKLPWEETNGSHLSTSVEDK